MLMSVDGKISTGADDSLDFDSDFPELPGIKEGLNQYYEIEQTTDLWSFNSGRVQAKLGVNCKNLPSKTSVSFVLLDNSHLDANGVRYFCARSKHFVLVTTNRDHPAFNVEADNLKIIEQDTLNLPKMLETLRAECGCERLTIQSGGTLNALFLRERLLDFVDIVVAPALVGGRSTSTLVDGDSILSKSELSKIGILKLERCEVLKHSYLRLTYRVLN